MDLKSYIEQEANKCVKCGLCSTVCPTYRLTQQEGESPRGRIALMDGIAQNKLAIKRPLVDYLDHCLTCRACEVVCPAEVPYSTLINATRNLIYSKQTSADRKSAIRHFLFRLLQYPRGSKLLAYILYFYQRMGLQTLARKSGLLKWMQLDHYDAIVPKLDFPTTFQVFYPPQNKHQGNIALFVNCINPVVEPATIHSTIQLLVKLGYGVYIPPKQTCCGALALHEGNREGAYQLIHKNIRAFSRYKISHVITYSSGCSLTLSEHSKLFTDTDIKDFSQQVIDIYSFLTAIKWPDNIYFLPLAKKVLLHHPCTLKNGLFTAKLPGQLLNKIPELIVLDMPPTMPCCGGAGEYFLRYPDTANTLLQPLIDYANQVKPDYLSTSNIGCHLQMYKGLPSISVCHPMTLLTNQLRIKN